MISLSISARDALPRISEDMVNPCTPNNTERREYICAHGIAAVTAAPTNNAGISTTDATCHKVYRRPDFLRDLQYPSIETWWLPCLREWNTGWQCPRDKAPERT